MASRRDHLLEICRCPNVKAGRASAAHPCAKVVRYQNEQISTLNEFQVPTPWVGQIHRARILFVSSNPSISYAEHHPTWRKSAETKADYFENHFGGGEQEWTKDGTHTLRRDDKYYRTKFYADIKRHAAELLGRAPQPGIDYALTCVVRCKSRKGIGVADALSECSLRYLRETVRASKARLIVVFGNPGRTAVSDVFGVLTGDAHIDGPLKVGRHNRLFVHLAHPSAQGKTKSPRRLTPNEVELLRPHLT